MGCQIKQGQHNLIDLHCWRRDWIVTERSQALCSDDQIEKMYCFVIICLVYTWGQIESRGVVIYKQGQPHMQQSTNIVNYSCGNSCIVCVDSYGDVFALGNNEWNQLHLKGEYFTKTFKKIPDQILGKIKRVFCIGDCTFFAN